MIGTIPGVGLQQLFYKEPELEQVTELEPVPIQIVKN
jgi:hypothetical protein